MPGAEVGGEPVLLVSYHKARASGPERQFSDVTFGTTSGSLAPRSSQLNFEGHVLPSGSRPIRHFKIERSEYYIFNNFLTLLLAHQPGMSRLDRVQIQSSIGHDCIRLLDWRFHCCRWYVADGSFITCDLTGSVRNREEGPRWVEVKHRSGGSVPTDYD